MRFFLINENLDLRLDRRNGTTTHMSVIDIFYSTRLKRGKYIADGKHGFGSVDGSPAMRRRWRGGFFPAGEQVFRFQTQTEIFAFLDTNSMEGTLYTVCAHCGLWPCAFTT